MRALFAQELEKLVLIDSRIRLITCDLGYGVLDSFASNHPDYYLNLGITEQASMSIAAGLASKGLRPFLYSIANFPTFRCLEQIRNDVHAMDLPVTIVGVGAGLGYGKAGYSHFAVEDISALRPLNIDIYNPSDAEELQDSLKLILSTERPAYLRLGGKLVAPRSELNFSESPASEVDLTIAYTGDIKSMVLDAAASIRKHGFSVRVVSLHVLTAERIDKFLAACSSIVLTVEEHVLPGGFSSFLLERANDLRKHIQIERLGLINVDPHLVGSQKFLQSQYGLTSENISARALQALGR